ncbi:MAG: hypothetical protein ACFFC9_16420 [Promethearchaeota archaeon]
MIFSSFIFQPVKHIYYNDYEEDKWDQDWPNLDENKEIKNEIIQELFSFICKASDEEFFNSI